MPFERNFRSAMNGFNRSDVVTFIEENTMAQEKALRQIRDENTRLHDAISKLRAENEALSNAVAATESLPTVEAPQPFPDSSHASASLPTYVPGELELGAYRRAESTERNARLRARKLYRQVNDIIESTTEKMAQSGDDVQTQMQDLSINLRRLTDTFAALKLTFDDTAAAFKSIEPLEISE